MSYAKNFQKMDKIDRLFDAMENPERYTAAEIEEMLQDPEVKEAFDLLDKMKSSLQTIDTPDIEDEWRAFENNHRQSEKNRLFWLTRFFPKNVAASIAIGIASFTAVAAIVGVGIQHVNNSRPETGPDVEMTAGACIAASHQDTVRSAETNNEVTPEIVVFDDETLETITNRIANYYGYKVIFNKNAAKSLRLHFRWDQARPIDEIVESLNNFEQITITINDKTIKID